MKNHTPILWGSLLSTLLLCLGTVGCGDEESTLETQTSALSSIWNIQRTHTQALDIAKDLAIKELQSLSTSIQSCLGNEGVSDTTITSTCNTKPRQGLYSSPYPVVDGQKVGAECYWDCTIEVPSKGIEYKSFSILQTYQSPSQASGGCP